MKRHAIKNLGAGYLVEEYEKGKFVRNRGWYRTIADAVKKVNGVGK